MSTLPHIIDALVRKLGRWLPDKPYLQIRYRCNMGRWIHWNNPTLYQEKLQWLKVYDRCEMYTQMVDKFAAKEYAAGVIGEEYIIPTLGVWDRFDDIDFDSLPEKFVLKTTNGGGNSGVVVCTEKSELDRVAAKKCLENSMSNSIYSNYREWPYKNVIPRILAEVYMSDDSEFNQDGLTDYKFTCFNGEADNVMVCCGRSSGNTKFYFLDRNWEILPLNKLGLMVDSSFRLPKPDCLDQMFDLAGKLSKGIPFLRVDMYYVDGHPYFGETTFFPASGFDPNILKETEVRFGNRIKLPRI